MKKALKIIALVVLIGSLLVAGVYGAKVAKRFIANLPSREKITVNAIYPITQTQGLNVLFEDQVLTLDHAPKMKGELIYLPVEFVKSYLNDQFYYDYNEKVLTYTTYKDVIRMTTDELTYFINEEPLELSIGITELEEGVPYMPLSLVSKFSDAEFVYNASLNLLKIEMPTVSKKYAKVDTGYFGTVLRSVPDDQQPYIRKVYGGEVVRVFETTAEWVKVRTEEGYIGYLRTKNIPSTYDQLASDSKLPQPDYVPQKNFKGKLNLTWHQVTNASANAYVQDVFANVSGVNVISPTWLSLSDEVGTVTSIADMNYVNWAHDNGYQVWALFDNSFSKKITHEVLSSTAKRTQVIKQVLALAEIYDLDGVNIDFESVAEEDGVYYVQFIKELSLYLKQANLVASVDMYVPAPWTAHYNRAEIGKYVDYLIIMGYDEHYGGSDESGSVASIGFVTKGVIDTLQDVPKEKVVLAMPFYTRLWKEVTTDGKVEVTSKAYSMDKIQEVLANNDATASWDETTMQNYAEFKVEDVTYKVWLEDEKSLSAKLDVMKENDLAGIASWKIGLQNDYVWPLLKSALQ